MVKHSNKYKIPPLGKVGMQDEGFGLYLSPFSAAWFKEEGEKSGDKAMVAYGKLIDDELEMTAEEAAQTIREVANAYKTIGNIIRESEIPVNEKTSLRMLKIIRENIGEAALFGLGD